MTTQAAERVEDMRRSWPAATLASVRCDDAAAKAVFLADVAQRVESDKAKDVRHKIPILRALAMAAEQCEIMARANETLARRAVLQDQHKPRSMRRFG